MFHRFTDGDLYRAWPIQRLESQLEQLERVCTVLPLSQAMQAWRRGEKRDKPIAVVTVDDGYGDFFDLAWPVFDKFGIRPTVFVTTDFISRKIWMWPDAVRYLLDSVRDGVFNVSFQGREFKVDLTSSEARKKSWEILCNQVLYESETLRAELTKRVEESVEFSLPKLPPYEYAAMTWDQIRELHAFGVEIGAHGRTHSSLCTLDSAQLIDETMGCREDIAIQIGASPCCFAYPNGSSRDHTPAIEVAVESAGYSCAVVAYPRVNTKDSNYAVGRWPGTLDAGMFDRVLSGAGHAGLVARKKLRFRQ